MRQIAVFLLLALAGLFLWFCVVIVDEREIAFRTLLDQAEVEVAGMSLNRAILDEPGVYVRIPFLHELRRFERRLQRFDSPARQALTSENLYIDVDYYAMWRIENPRVFFESFSGIRTEVQRRVDNTTYNAIKTAVGGFTIRELLSEKREAMMDQIIAASDTELRNYGIRVLDIRVRRSDYPAENLENVYERMRSERKRFALKLRAEGEEAGRRIRSSADQEAQVEIAKAERRATELRGSGDATAAEIYAKAYGKDPEFYAFLRSLEAYRKSLDRETTVVLSREMPFLRYLFEDGSGGKP